MKPLARLTRSRMNHQHTSVVIVALSVLVISAVLAAQDRYSLKDGNGISLSEFRGYDAWPLIAVSHPDNAGGCGSSKEGCIKGILANAAMVKAYNDGIPANGKPVPDGAAFAKIEWSARRNSSSPYGVTVPGAQTEVAFMVKDSKRFADTNGWGYATFQYDAESNLYKPAHNDGSFARTCHACHTVGAKARDFVFTSYAKR